MPTDAPATIGGLILLWLPWLVPLAYFIGGLACHLHARYSVPQPSVSPAPAALPHTVHPVLVDALMDTSSLDMTAADDRFVAWFAACAIHAAGTDGSLKVETHAPVDDEAESLLSSIKVTRLQEPSDPVDALVTGIFLPTGTSDAETAKLRKSLDSMDLDPREAGRLRAVLSNRTRPRRDSVTLQELLEELREEHGGMSGTCTLAREALSDMASAGGYLRPDPYHGKLTHGPLATAALLWTVFGAPIASVAISMNGSAKLPDGPMPLLILLGCVALVWVAAHYLYPWSVPLTQAGSDIAAAGRAIADEPASRIANQGERDQLLAAAFLAAHDSTAPNASELAVQYARRVEGRPGSGFLGTVAAASRPMTPDDPTDDWRLAYAAFCLPVLVRGESRRKTVTSLSLCRNRFLKIVIDIVDPGVDV